MSEPQSARQVLQSVAPERQSVVSERQSVGPAPLLAMSVLRPVMSAQRPARSVL